MVVGALHHFDVAPNTVEPVVGVTVTVTVTAHDQFSNTVTSVSEYLGLNHTGADEPANLEWSGTGVIDNNNGTGRFIGSWTSGVSTVYVTYTKANDAVTLAVTGESSGKVGTSAAVTWGPVAILTIVGTAYQNGNDTIVIGFNTEVQPADEGPWDADVFTSVKHGTTSVSLVGASYTPASGLTDTLTITLDETNAYLVRGATMYVTPALNAIKDAAGNFAPITEKTGSAVSGDTVVPTFTIAYYTDSGLTTLLTNNYMKVGTYYIKITANEALSAAPTISIAADGTANDVTNAATTAVASSTKVFKYTRTIASDAAATGEAIEAITITGTDLAGNTATNYAVSGEKYTDTVVPIIASVVGQTIAGAGDKIVITFTEASGEIATPAATAWSAAAFTYIKCGTVTLGLPDAASAYVYGSKVLTITLANNTENAYLVNDAALVVKAVASAIKDTAGNAVAATDKTGSVSNKETGTPTFTVAGAVKTGDDTITITFNETVRPADGTWSANEFTIESPNGAPLNINHATFAPATGMAGSLTITLNEATDGAFLVVGDAVKVYRVTSPTDAVLDLAGNAVSTASASSPAVADPALPTITSIVGTTIQGAGDTIVITFSEAVTPAESTPVWSSNELVIQSPDESGLTLTNAVFSIDETNKILTVTLKESEAYLVNGNLVLVTPGENDIKDADGNFVAITEVPSVDEVGGDEVLPTITSIIGTVIPGSEADYKDIIRIDFSEAVVPVGAWSAETQLGISNADLAGATFVPTTGITTTLTITLNTGKDLVAGQTLTVTPEENKVLDLAGNALAINPVPSVQPVNQSYAIDLVAGWNLISLPLIPDSSAIATVLTGVTVDSVWNYAAPYSDDSWSSYFPGAPDDLVTMVDGKGYWVNMNAPAVLIIQGVEMSSGAVAPRSYDVVVGWNFIGFKSITAKLAGGAVGSYLEALGTNYTLIYAFDAASQSYVTVQSGDTGDTFEPGKGYWIAITADGTIYP